MSLKILGISIFLTLIVFTKKTNLLIDIRKIIELNQLAATGDPKPEDLVRTYLSFFYKFIMAICLFFISITLLFVPL
ncbi:MAG: hypothetical protein WD898_03525 [Candidatus Paceibacterota bacterium]